MSADNRSEPTVKDGKLTVSKRSNVSCRKSQLNAQGRCTHFPLSVLRVGKGAAGGFKSVCRIVSDSSCSADWAERSEDALMMTINTQVRRTFKGCRLDVVLRRVELCSGLAVRAWRSAVALCVCVWVSLSDNHPPSHFPCPLSLCSAPETPTSDILCYCPRNSFTHACRT